MEQRDWVGEIVLGALLMTRWSRIAIWGVISLTNIGVALEFFTLTPKQATPPQEIRRRRLHVKFRVPKAAFPKRRAVGRGFSGTAT